MPFIFRYQPFNALYTLCGVVYILAAVPLWAIGYALPSWRPRPTWSLKRSLIARVCRAYIRVMFQTSPPTTLPLAEFAKNAGALGFVWVRATPELIVGEVQEIAQKNGVEAAQIGGFWYGPRGPDGQAGQGASPDERVVYYMHGGGHIFGSANPGALDGFTGLFKSYLEYLGPNLRIFALEYRVSSAAPFGQANPFPASLVDTIAGYRYLVEDVGFKPSNIIVSGDSSGGGLAFNLVRYIAQARLPGLPTPGGVILLSPTMDWAQTHTGTHSSMIRNARSDAVNVILESGYTRRALVGKLSEGFAAKSAWISPGSLQAEWAPGMCAGIPRTVIVAGGAEYTLDPMHTARDRLAADIGEDKVTFIEPPDAMHDFLLLGWHEPERTEVLEQLGTWVKRL